MQLNFVRVHILFGTLQESVHYSSAAKAKQRSRDLQRSAKCYAKRHHVPIPSRPHEAKAFSFTFALSFPQHRKKDFATCQRMSIHYTAYHIPSNQELLWPGKSDGLEPHISLEYTITTLCPSPTSEHVDSKPTKSTSLHMHIRMIMCIYICIYIYI